MPDAARRSGLPLVHHETDRRALTLFALAGLAVAVFYGVVFTVWEPVASTFVAAMAIVCGLIAIAALVAARSRHRTAAAVVIVTTAAVSLVFATAALSTQSDVHLLYLAVAFAMLALFPERLMVMRAAYGIAIFVTVVAVEFVFPSSAAWSALAPEVANWIAASNRVWTVIVSACAVVVILVRSARLQRALFGAARSGERRANTDVLTSLANRRPVLARFAEFDAAPGKRYTVVIVDVDSFKEINDAYGHDTGDKVIVEVAARLREHFGSDALVSRWGGDEFLAVVEGENSIVTVHALERLRRTTSRFPIRVEGERLPVTLSVGAATSAPGMSSDDTLRAADMALYAAKQEGRNRVVMAADRVGGTA